MTYCGHHYSMHVWCQRWVLWPPPLHASMCDDNNNKFHSHHHSMHTCQWWQVQSYGPLHACSTVICSFHCKCKSVILCNWSAMQRGIWVVPEQAMQDTMLCIATMRCYTHCYYCLCGDYVANPLLYKTIYSGGWLHGYVTIWYRVFSWWLKPKSKEDHAISDMEIEALTINLISFKNSIVTVCITTHYWE